MGSGARWAVVLVVPALAAACTDSRPRPAEDAPLASPVATHEEDGDDHDALGALVDRTARTFERDGDALVTHGTVGSWSSTVAADGLVTFRPSARATPAVTLRSMTRSTSIAMDADAVAIARGSIVEKLRNAGSHLEQSWRFSSPPESPPVIRVAVDGMRFAGSTTTGLHFTDDASGLGLRYGAATWIDAHGTKTSVPVTFENGELVMRVAPEAANGPYPAVLDPTLTPEQGIDQPTTEAAGNTYVLSLVAGPAQTFLATWVEQLAGAPSIVRAVRVGSDGATIGAPVTLANVTRESIGVAWDGTRWLVVIAGAASTSLVRVASDGTIVDAVPKTIAGESSAVSVAFDGTRFFVAWRDLSTPASASIKSVRVDGATGLADLTTLLTLAAPGTLTGYNLHAACGSAAIGCAAAFRGPTKGLVSRVSNANVLLDPNGIDAGTTVDPGGLASDGNQWVVAWDTGSAIKSARVSSAGAVTPNTDFAIGFYNILHDLAFDGTDFVAVWRRSLSSYYLSARRMQPTGTFVEAQIDLEGPGPYLRSAAFAASGSTRVVLFSRDTTGFPVGALLARPYSAALVAAGPAKPIVQGSNIQLEPYAAFNGSSFLVTWNDSRSSGSGSGSYAARLDVNGTPIDTVGTKIDFNGELASDGDGFLAVRTNGSKIEALRFAKTSATPIAPTPILVGTNAQFGPAKVAFDGTNYVVVWSSSKTVDLTGDDVRAARITPAGVLLDPEGFAVTTAAGPQTECSIASDGKGSLVVWVDRRDDYYDGDVWGARLTPAGVVLDPQGFTIAARARGQFRPHASASGDGYTVVWRDTASGSNDTWATTVSAAGVVSPNAFAVGSDLGGQEVRIVATGDGSTQLVAWPGANAPGMYGAFIRRSPNVELLDSPALELSPKSATQGFALVSAGSGRAALFHSRYIATERAYRLRMRFIGSGTKTGATCASAGDCATRYCRESVCCSEKCDGACRKCAATTGACEIVRSADDPDTCSGENTCDADGACKKRNGSICEQASECASGHCVGSFCCNVACEGSCETCSETRGTCTPRVRGSLGVPSCSPHRCDGASRTCSAACLVDTDCADGFGCDRPTGTCISGAVCEDIQTLRDRGASTQCAPYACRNGKCGQSCKDVGDCAFPAVCEESGRCIAPPATSASSCSFAPSSSPDGTAALFATGLAFALSRTRTRARRRRR